jgi:hypothetical protein
MIDEQGHRHQPAPAMVLVLDKASFRHSSAAHSRWPAQARDEQQQHDAAVGRRERARSTTSSPRARTAAATSGASEATNGICHPAKDLLSSYLKIREIYCLILDKIRYDCWVSRRYATHDATRFRDAWAPHTQTQGYG